MPSEIKIGQRVRLTAVPDWLIHDLPDEEKREILSYIGKDTVVTEIDGQGYFWIGFGETHEAVDSANYSGHSFCVPAECLELAEQER